MSEYHLIDKFESSPIRTSLPILNRNSNKTGIIEILKNFIGKDLSKVSIPITFNEPLSFLQRITECLCYSDLLDNAAVSTDEKDVLVYLSCFSISSVSNMNNRYYKPFNPILNETFEWIDKSKGIMCLCEQVSHHPPISLLHAESSKWTYWEENNVKIVFKGTYISVESTSNAFFRIKSSNKLYSWVKPDTIISNLFSKMIIYPTGKVSIKSHNSNYNSVIKYDKVKNSSKERFVIANIYNDKELIETLYGDCNLMLISKSNDKTVVEFNKNKSIEESFGFNQLSISLNNPINGYLCPTDSRLRPDQRLYENEQLEDAKTEKMRLEENQRIKIKQMKFQNPKWFTKQKIDTLETYVYNGSYWTSKLHECFEDIKIF